MVLNNYRLCSRNGSATRLSYDHKGSDTNETHRIMESGGFVVNGRVNGNGELVINFSQDFD